MRRRAHAAFAVLLAAASAYLLDLPVPIALLGIVEAFACSALPDITEPGTHRGHRGTFHSQRALAASALLCLLGLVLMRFHPFPYSPFIFFGALGYLSHLMLDAVTGRLPR